MKYILLASVLSLVAATGCQRYSLTPTGSAIRYEVIVADIATKGELVNNNENGDYSDIALAAALSPFRVAAFNGSNPVFTTSGLSPAGVETVKYTSGSWTMPNTYYWPQATSLTFFAYANLPETGATVTNTCTSDSRKQTLAYTLPLDARQQNDVMLGWYGGDGNGESTADITLIHPLSSIVLKQGEMVVDGIKSITVSGLYASGTVDVTYAAGAGGIVPTYDWGETRTGSVASTLTPTGSDTYISVDADGIIGTPFIVIPQSVEANQVKITVTASVSGADKNLVVNVPAGAFVAGETHVFTLGYKAVLVTGITLNPTSKTIAVDGNFTITATVSPSDATDKTVTWTSSDNTIATVDASGNVIGVKAGTATITASAGGKTATCTVTVAPAGSVPIKAKYNGTDSTIIYWAKQNLSISNSGKNPWKGDNTSAVKVPGTDENVMIGDYFQWAAHAGYCGKSSDSDKGLLVYTSFKNEGCGATSNSFSFKSGKQFDVSTAPYSNSSSSYRKYTSSSEATLVQSDDVAHIILGGSWRMPTSAEFKAMIDATYWAWDDKDKGYYVYAPNPATDAGMVNSGTGTYNKANALLFFPAAGYGSETSLKSPGSYGYYYSSSSDPSINATSMYFQSSNVYAHGNSGRYHGHPVRPVSD